MSDKDTRAKDEADRLFKKTVKAMLKTPPAKSKAGSDASKRPKDKSGK